LSGAERASSGAARNSIGQISTISCSSTDTLNTGDPVGHALENNPHDERAERGSRPGYAMVAVARGWRKPRSARPDQTGVENRPIDH
jgi:hypothetical protein